MTLETFARKTYSRLEIPYDEIASSVNLARRISKALRSTRLSGLRSLFPGAGLLWSNRALWPTVLVSRAHAKIDSDNLEPLEKHPILYETLQRLRITPPLSAVHVLPVFHGVRQVSPGDSIMSMVCGCAGPHVQWGSSDGFLTAGHVAQSVGGNVTNASGVSVGSVIWSNDPALHHSRAPDLDAALVEFNRSHSASTGMTARIAAAPQSVTVVSNGLSANVFGFLAHVQLGTASACYADCYCTDQKISNSGDSGSSVEVGGDVTGMVIGAFTHRNMTIIQSIDYQLKEIQSRSGHVISI